jgi:hypothetical protein
MAHDFDRNAQLHRIAEVQKRIEQAEADIIAQNEIIAALEGRGRDAREARAIRAQLWVSQESDIAEMDRLLEEMNSQDGRQ